MLILFLLFYYSSSNAGQLKVGINLFDLSIVLMVNLLQGTAHLLYPFWGWVDEVCFNNFRMIKWLFIIVLIGSLPTIAFSATSIILHLSQSNSFGFIRHLEVCLLIV